MAMFSVSKLLDSLPTYVHSKICKVLGYNGKNLQMSQNRQLRRNNPRTLCLLAFLHWHYNICTCRRGLTHRATMEAALSHMLGDYSESLPPSSNWVLASATAQVFACKDTCLIVASKSWMVGGGGGSVPDCRQGCYSDGPPIEQGCNALNLWIDWTRMPSNSHWVAWKSPLPSLSWPEKKRAQQSCWPWWERN